MRVKVDLLYVYRQLIRYSNNLWHMVLQSCIHNLYNPLVSKVKPESIHVNASFLLAHLTEDHESLWYGAVSLSVIRLASTF